MLIPTDSEIPASDKTNSCFIHFPPAVSRQNSSDKNSNAHNAPTCPLRKAQQRRRRSTIPRLCGPPARPSRRTVCPPVPLPQISDSSTSTGRSSESIAGCRMPMPSTSAESVNALTPPRSTFTSGSARAATVTAAEASWPRSGESASSSPPQMWMGQPAVATGVPAGVSVGEDHVIGFSNFQQLSHLRPCLR